MRGEAGRDVYRGTERLSSRIYMNVFQAGQRGSFGIGRHLELTLLTRHLAMSAQYCPGQGGMKHLCGKNRPTQAGISVAENGIPARRDGTKNVPPAYKQYAIKTIETYMSGSRASSSPGKRPVPPLI